MGRGFSRSGRWELSFGGALNSASARRVPKAPAGKSGSHPGVLLWPDVFGLRPAMRDKRLAASGYSVVVPNPFYRVSKAPFTDASKLDFQNPDDRAKLGPLTASFKPGRQRRERCRGLRGLPGRKSKSTSQRKSVFRVTAWADRS